MYIKFLFQILVFPPLNSQELTSLSLPKKINYWNLH